jgi:hypothetical protein
LKATTYIEFVQTTMQMDRASKLHGSMLEGMNIQGATGLTHAQAATLKALGASHSEANALWARDANALTLCLTRGS